MRVVGLMERRCSRCFRSTVEIEAVFFSAEDLTLPKPKKYAIVAIGMGRFCWNLLEPTYTSSADNQAMRQQWKMS